MEKFALPGSGNGSDNIESLLMSANIGKKIIVYVVSKTRSRPKLIIEALVKLNFQY